MKEGEIDGVLVESDTDGKNVTNFVKGATDGEIKGKLTGVSDGFIESEVDGQIEDEVDGIDEGFNIGVCDGALVTFDETKYFPLH